MRPVRDEIDVTVQRRKDHRVTVHLKLIGWTETDLQAAIGRIEHWELRRVLQDALGRVK